MTQRRVVKTCVRLLTLITCKFLSTNHVTWVEANSPPLCLHQDRSWVRQSQWVKLCIHVSVIMFCVGCRFARFIWSLYRGTHLVLLIAEVWVICFVRRKFENLIPCTYHQYFYDMIMLKTVRCEMWTCIWYRLHDVLGSAWIISYIGSVGKALYLTYCAGVCNLFITSGRIGHPCLCRGRQNKINNVVDSKRNCLSLI
jgi:hypothetical protein